MTNEKLQKIAKRHKIDLSQYDEVLSFINENYTFVLITFAVRENLGGNAYHHDRLKLKLSVSAIMKRVEFEDDYCTNGWEWIFDIRNK